ncbi:MAG TPA: hypothetical protein VFH54_06055 [Mycobacteriales bacterium]|nr:hypothetical protein [Mycobacteriales bacterium]
MSDRSPEAAYPTETITLSYAERANGVLWTITANEEPVASGWALDVQQARREAHTRLHVARRWLLGTDDA